MLAVPFYAWHVVCKQSAIKTPVSFPKGLVCCRGGRSDRGRRSRNELHLFGQQAFLPGKPWRDQNLGCLNITGNKALPFPAGVEAFTCGLHSQSIMSVVCCRGGRADRLYPGRGARAGRTGEADPRHAVPDEERRLQDRQVHQGR